MELKAQFEEWKGASQLGLVLNGSKQSGYRFVIATASGPAAPPFSAVHAAHGTFSLQLFRGEALLREEFVFSAQIDPDQPLRLLARREGDRLLLQANELKPVEFRDPFAMSVGQRGSFGVIWPSGVVIRRLLGGQQGLAAEPSPLDVGDDLFLQGKVEEALDRYGEAAQASPRADLRQEALYKQGLCDLRLNREEAARRIFEGLGAGFVGASKGSDTRWAFLADCQLLVLYFREKGGLDKATLLLEKLAGYGYTFDTFALLMPPDVQREVLNNVHIGSVGGNLHLRPEELIARSEFAIRASELLEPPGPHTEWKYHSLMRAYMSVGRNSDAYKTADKAFRSGRYGGEVLDSYCWVLRTEGKYEQALEKLDRALADDPTHYVERARIHAAMKQWDAALADVDAYLAKPADYLSFSSACLIKGFVLEQKGAPPAQAEDAWRRGLARNWKPTEKERGTDLYIPGRAPAGMPMLNNWIMASLLDDLPDADAEQLLGGLLAFAGKDNPVFNKMMRPSMLRATWRSPRGRDMARRQAFRDQPFSEALRVPLFLGWIAFIREICFDPTVPFSDEQDEVIWRMSTVIYEAYRNGVLTERYFLPFAAIVQGNPNSPGMGWREVAVLLEKLPELRGPLAYVFGARYVKKGDPKTALLFYRSALADAARDPAQPLLQRLAQAEIDRLSAK